MWSLSFSKPPDLYEPFHFHPLSPIYSYYFVYDLQTDEKKLCSCHCFGSKLPCFSDTIVPLLLGDVYYTLTLKSSVINLTQIFSIHLTSSYNKNQVPPLSFQMLTNHMSFLLFPKSLPED
jgi:hypothetical protein